ncbi:hypothetical protein ACN9KI_03565 [Aliarcobacter butzleri]|uniref:hypothetical protein n=2 Tax=Aliarcobacter butzleri TaxID=28197 RepID=UPI003B218E6F
MAKNWLSIKRMGKVLNAFQKGKQLQAKDLLNNNGWCDVLNSDFNFTGRIIYRFKNSKKIIFGFKCYAKDLHNKGK